LALRHVAFADDNGAVHLDLVHGFAHGFDGDLVGFVAIAEAHGAGGRNGPIFNYAQKFKAECFFHSGALRGRNLRAKCGLRSIGVWEAMERTGHRHWAITLQQ